MNRRGAEIVGVLPAAGAGRRFRGAKLLFPVGGRPMVLRALAALGPCDRVVAVVRPGDAPLAKLLRAAGAQVVENPQPHRGMGRSIACGVAAAGDARGWCILPGDMPWVSASSTARVVAALRAGAALAAPVCQGRRGHPVGFARAFRAELLALDGDRGGRGILARHERRLRNIPVADPGVLRDVDHAPAAGVGV